MNKKPSFFKLQAWRNLSPYAKSTISIYERALDLIDAVYETRHLKGDYVEAGVYQGDTAKIICEVKGGKKLHLFDTFEGLPKSMFEPIDLSTSSAKRQLAPGKYAASLAEVKENLKQFNNVFYYPGIFPDTAKPLEHKSFAFVHLDMDLYKSTLEGLKFFYPRLNDGGIIISHNYTNMPGVKASFDEFFEDKPEEIEEIGFTQGLIKKHVFGGHCLPKDLQELMYGCENNGLRRTVWSLNEVFKKHDD